MTKDNCDPLQGICKTVLDSGIHAVNSGFQGVGSTLCQWNLDSGFQSKAQDPGIPQAKFSRIRESAIPLRGTTNVLLKLF